MSKVEEENHVFLSNLSFSQIRLLKFPFKIIHLHQSIHLIVYLSKKPAVALFFSEEH